MECKFNIFKMKIQYDPNQNFRRLLVENDKLILKLYGNSEVLGWP